MTRSFSNFANNLSEEIDKIKDGHDYAKCKTCRIRYKYCNYFLEYINFKDNSIEYKWLFSNKNYPQNFYEKLKEWFSNIYIYSNYDNNKFILLLWKGVYTYEYMDKWEKFNETSLSEKKYFYSPLNIEDITDTYYAREKRVCIDFKIKVFRRILLFVYSRQYNVVS